MLLTPRLMQQALADRIAGGAPRLDPAQLTEPWATCWRVLEGVPRENVHAALFEGLAGNPDRDAIITAILKQQPGATEQHIPLKDLAADLPPIEWLWPEWIPRGMLTLFGAIPGAGKSLVALDLCKRIIEGGKFPDGLPVPRPGAPVLYVDAENVPQIINERAAMWKMDTSKLYLLLPQVDNMLDFSKPDDQYRLIEKVYDIRPELVIIDSLSSISSKGENAIEDVRTILSFLSGLAREYAIGLVLIHHVRKRGQTAGQVPLFTQISIDDFRGSGHIVAMARSVLGLSVVQTGPKPDKNGPRQLEVVKTNLGRYPDAVGFEMKDLHPKGVMLKWGNAPEPYQEPTKLDECITWLEDLISKAGDEGLPPKEVVEVGKAEGFGQAMIYRARETLTGKIKSTQGRRNPGSRWAWAEGDEEEDE